MVEIGINRYFDPRFLHFGITALVLKFIVYYIQSQLNPTMSFLGSDDVVSLKRGNSSATVHLFGATLTSWVADGQEVLFVSRESLFDKKKAIRGGVPVVFPHFGPWGNSDQPKPQHGFARISRWAVKDESSKGSNSVTFVLEDSPATRKLWDFKFRVDYTLTLISDKQIKMDVVITNTGLESFPFQFLLHTYFSVPDILLCKVDGLLGCTYIDKVKNSQSFVEDRNAVTVTEFTDRVYTNTPLIQRVHGISGGRTAIVEKFNFPDTVVWNPWIENAEKLSDFGDDEWKHMICVEAGSVNVPVILEPQQSFVAAQILSID